MDAAATAKRKQTPAAAAATVSDAAAGAGSAAAATVAASEPTPCSPFASSPSTGGASSLPRVTFWQLPLSVDLRALAFLRMSIALLLIHDIFVRLSTFDIFYSDAGAWPLENHVSRMRAATAGRLRLGRRLLSSLSSHSASVALSLSICPVSLRIQIRDLEGEMMFSIFFACHHDLWQRLMFGLALFLSSLFFLGYRTRQVKFAVWAMMISTQNRMTIGASGGDDLLAGVMFFCMFLPLEARFSVDAALQRRSRRTEGKECAATAATSAPSNGAAPDVAAPVASSRRTRNAHVSVASFALVLQPCVMYVFSGVSPHCPHLQAHARDCNCSCSAYPLPGGVVGVVAALLLTSNRALFPCLLPLLALVLALQLLKTGKAWYPDCTALWYALSGLDYVRPMGIWLREVASFELLKAITFATLVLEFAGPCFFFSPWKHAFLRVGAVLAFCGFHLGIMATLALGNFPVVCCVVLLTLLPRQAWDALEDSLRRLDAVGQGERCDSTAAATATAPTPASDGEGAPRRAVPLLLVMPRATSSPATGSGTDALAREVEQLAHAERVEAWQKAAALAAHFGLLSFEVADGSSYASGRPVPATAPVHERRARGALVVLDESGRESRNNSALMALLSRSLPARLLRRCTGLRIQWFAVGFLPLFALVKAINRSPSALSWLHWLLPWSPSASASSLRSRWPHRASLLRNFVCAVGLVYVLLQNVSTVTWVKEHYPSISALNSAPWGHPAMLLKLDQRWAMFAPGQSAKTNNKERQWQDSRAPLVRNRFVSQWSLRLLLLLLFLSLSSSPDPYSRVGWLVLRGELRLSAQELEQDPRPAARFVDAETLSLSSAVSFTKPALLSAKYDNVYYYDFFDNMEGNEDHYGPYASYYCRRWNLHHASSPANQLHQIDMFIVEHFVTLPGEKAIPIKKSLVWQQLCDMQEP